MVNLPPHTHLCSIPGGETPEPTQRLTGVFSYGGFIKGQASPQAGRAPGGGRLWFLTEKLMLCLWRRSIRLVLLKAAPGENTPPLSAPQRERERDSVEKDAQGDWNWPGHIKNQIGLDWTDLPGRECSSLSTVTPAWTRAETVAT